MRCACRIMRCGVTCERAQTSSGCPRFYTWVGYHQITVRALELFDPDAKPNCSFHSDSRFSFIHVNLPDR